MIVILFIKINIDICNTYFLEDKFMVTQKKTSSTKKKWSKNVTEHSNALDLEDKIFTKSPKEIALSLKHSAEVSTRRKGTPYQSAMSMLTFYQNRAGKNLNSEQKEVIQKAKEELRKLFGRE